MPTGIAIDSRKAVARIAALEEAFDDLFLDGAPQPPRAVPLHAASRTATAGSHAAWAAGTGRRAPVQRQL